MDVRYCYNLVTGFIEQLSTDSTNVSRSLNHYTGLSRCHLEALYGFVDNKKYAAARRFTPARRAAEVDGLSSDHSRDGMTSVHRVSVHDPGHGLLVGIHVRSRHVLFWSNEVDQLCGITPRHPLELTHRHDLWIADDSALGAAEGHIHDRALPRHPRREGSHLVEIYVGCISDPALRWTTREVMLHPITLKHLNATGVHLRRYVDFQLAVGHSQHGIEVRIEIQQLCGAIESRHHRLKRILFFYLSNIINVNRAIHADHWSLSIKAKLRSLNRCENLADQV